ncbi:cation-translocating P-type ATPase [Kineosporia sp. R_H_3]|uniref:heavy metal translocating P-type ATPase n=1 Tax=Kineosporia sp. R_H_3 TaxID=1961848 RepID=UPI000B4B1A35|nr:heavy metal translocating P-type ATPase [Kineosporia sp. R_H_3]
MPSSTTDTPPPSTPSTAPATPPPVVPLVTLDLPVTGMTCASCAARIEKKLNRMDGVTASVNYATESAHVSFPAGLDPHDLVATIERTGYGATLPPPPPAPPQPDVATDGPPSAPAADAADTRLEALRQRLLVSAALALPVLVLSMVPALAFDGWQWIALTLASPVAVWGAWPFHRAAVVNARHGATTMDTLVSLGVTAAYLWSLYALLFTASGDVGTGMRMDMAAMRAMGGADLYLEVAAVVTVFLLAGRYAEARAKRRSGAAMRALLELGAKDVARLRVADDGSRTEERVPVDRLAVGDLFVVRPGEKVATDAVVVEGTSALDESLLTGEPVPVDVGPGDTVTGATVNTSGRLVLRATRVGADTRLAQIGRLVTAAQSGKAPVQRLADRVSAVFVPVVLVIAVGTLVTWLVVTGDVTAAFTAAVAVLVIACPCALGLATPTALLVGTGRGAQLGIVIKGPEVLEQTRRADTVVLDKTGTVTQGRMRLVDVTASDDARAAGFDADDALRLAGAVESGSEHPVAAAVTDAARERLAELGGALPDVESFASTAGQGVTGRVRTAHSAVLDVTVGSRALLAGRGLAVPADLDAALDAAEAAGRTAVLVGWDGAARGMLAVADTLKPTSREAVAALRALGLRPVLLTGDNARAAAAVAAEVGIAPEDVVAGVAPEGKVDVVRRLQAEGRVVAMVGDGVNDAAALAQADLGLTMGSGTDVAIEAGDLTLVRSDLRSAADAIALSRRTLATIKGNLFWAFAYNVAALPLAALGLLNPLVAGGAMAFSSVFVVTNSLRLRRFTPHR